MCHTVIAQRICEICGGYMGETVVDFTGCARKCRSPFYCLTPKPQMEICALCVPGAATTAATAAAAAAARSSHRPVTSISLSSSSSSPGYAIRRGNDRRGSASTASTSASHEHDHEDPFSLLPSA